MAMARFEAKAAAIFLLAALVLLPAATGAAFASSSEQGKKLEQTEKSNTTLKATPEANYLAAIDELEMPTCDAGDDGAPLLTRTILNLRSMGMNHTFEGLHALVTEASLDSSPSGVEGLRSATSVLDPAITVGNLARATIEAATSNADYHRASVDFNIDPIVPPDQTIYEAMLTAFAVAIGACWIVNCTFASRRSLSQRVCVLLAFSLILTSVTHVRCDDDDDDGKSPNQEAGAGAAPAATPSPPPIIVPLRFPLYEEDGSTTFFKELFEAFADDTLPDKWGHIFFPEEAPRGRRVRRWIAVAVPYSANEDFATLYFRADNGYLMGYETPEGDLWCTSDAKAYDIFPVKGCIDLGFSSSYRGLTGAPTDEHDFHPRLQIELGQQKAIEAARDLARYGSSVVGKEHAQRAMLQFAMLISESQRFKPFEYIFKEKMESPNQALCERSEADF